MQGFYCQAHNWYADGVALAQLAADYQTPCYVYSQSVLVESYRRLQAAFPCSTPKICYAVKSNDNIALLKILAAEGAGFDIVSGGELQRVLLAGAAAKDIVFSGVGKSTAEIKTALAADIGCFNVESEQELMRIEQAAAASAAVARVALRLTLDIDGDTHRHLTTGVSGGKFGVSAADGQRLARVAAHSSHLDFLGFSCHVGSQISDENIYLRLAAAMAAQVQIAQEAGIDVRQIDMGGGFGVDYKNLAPVFMPLAQYDKTLADIFGGKQLIIEPGRSIAAAAGVLLTRVEYVKTSGDKTICIVDASMATFMRPALYNGYHPVLPVAQGARAEYLGDVAGPICESADFLAHDRPLTLQQGEVAALFNVGAYGMVMANNYNAHPRPGEVLTHNGKWREIRRAENVQDMLRFESL